MKNKGFTLIELLTYTAIFTVLMLVIVSFVLSFITSNTKYQIKRGVIENADIIMRNLSHEIERASSIYAPTSTLGSHPGQLSLETTNEAPPNEVRSYVDFYLNDANLYIKREGSDALRLNSADTKITNLVFEKFKPEAIKIQITIEHRSSSSKPERRFSYSLGSAFSIRN